MRLTSILFFAVFQLSIGGDGFCQTLEWAKMFGGDYIDRPNTIALDRFGNSYTTGLFSTTADFDPGPGVFEITKEGGYYDCYVSKLNPEGEFVWAKSFSGDRDCEGYDIEIDLNGNIYIVGEFWGNVDFDPGLDTFNLYNEDLHAGFVVKLDSAGDFLWAFKLGNGTHLGVRSIDSDENLNIYFTGAFTDSIDLDPGPDSFMLTDPGYYSDLYACKLDGDGNFIWGKHFLGSRDEFKSNVVVSSGFVYLSGNFTESIELNPGGSSVLLNSFGAYDMFVSKFDVDGTFVWAKQFGGDSQDVCTVLEVDSLSNVYAAGQFSDTVDFDPSSNIHNLSSVDEFDIMVFKLDSDGELVWCKQMNGGDEFKMAHSLAIGANGSVYVGGYFEGVVDFDPGLADYFVASDSSIQTFVVSLSNNGQFEWAFGTGGWALDYGGNKLALDDSANVYITGYFLGTADFDPGPNVYPLTSDWYEVYVQKISPPKRYSSVSFQEKNSGNLFPNPTAGILHLKSGQTPLEVSVLDLLGKIIYNPIPNGNTIDLSQVPSGTYIVKYTTDQNSFVQKIQVYH